jgi:hypothetical protein
MVEDKVCFVISPIGSSESATRERADHVFDYVIEEALEDFDYTPKRADHIAEPGIITNDVIEYIVESPLVIADLTDSNANVFYELAIRHAYEKPTIQIIEEGEDIPFDLASTRTISFDHSDVESVAEAKSKIVEQIESINNESETFENPITVAEDIRDLKSGSRQERSVAELIENISGLRSEMRSIEKKVNDPKEILPPEYLGRVLGTLPNEGLNHIYEELLDLEDLINSIIDASEDKTNPESIEVIEDYSNEASRKIDNVIQIIERSRSKMNHMDELYERHYNVISKGE